MIASTRAPARADPGEMLVSLQYLRAVAALMVVYFHAALQAGKLGGPAAGLPAVGASGVDIFFVLSGFVMVVSTRARRGDPVDFLKRRLARIAPLYWLLTLAAAAVALLAPWLLRSTVFDAAHLAASLAFVPWRNPAQPDLLGVAAVTPVIVPGWTLNFEMMFYLLFALSLLVPEERRRLPALTLIVAAFYVACVLLRARLWFGFFASPMMFEFVAGAWLAAALAGREGPRSRIVPLAGLVAGFVLLLSADARWGEGLRWLHLGLPALAIVLCAVLVERTGAMPFSRLWGELGNASYSIYLSHVFVIAGLRIAMSLGHLRLAAWSAPLFVLTALVCSVAVGLAIHVACERPLTRAANAMLRGERRRRDLPVSVA